MAPNIRFRRATRLVYDRRQQETEFFFWEV